MPARKPIMPGEKFGFLNIVSEGRKIRLYGLSKWEHDCLCVCGNRIVKTSANLRCWSHSLSCGCKRYVRQAHKIKHGGSANYAYGSWFAMINRCTNPKYTGYYLYGGRGIKVDPRWMDFRNFLLDMGARPQGKTIDRYPNKNGNYELGNCRWATNIEQQRNKRNTVMITHEGITMPRIELASKYGISNGTLRSRLKRGLSIEAALFNGTIDRCQKKWLEFDGKILMQSDWAKLLNVSEGTLHYRINHWPLERALTKGPGYAME